MSQPSANSNPDARRRPEREEDDDVPAPLAVLDLPATLPGGTYSENELHGVIEQLRGRARDQRAHAMELEKAKENLEEQLETALVQLHTARDRELALRARLADSIAIAKQRDEAGAALQRNTKTISDLQKCLGEARREHEEATRQREEAAGQLAAVTHSAEAASAQLAQAQKQVLAIRLARDAAQAQSLGFTKKLSAAEDEIAELVYARQALERTGAQTAAEFDALRREYLLLSHDRDRLIAQVAELSGDVDQNRSRILDLAEQKNAANSLDDELSAALAQARLQVAGLARERDASRERAAEQTAESEKLHAEMQTLRSELIAAQTADTDLEELRRQHATMLAERDTRLAEERELSRENTAQQERLSALADELAAAQRRAEEALRTAGTAQKQIDDLTRERDEGRDAKTDEAVILEAQLAALRTRDAELVEALDAAEQQAERDAHEFEKQKVRARRCESYRMESIELAGRLDAAQRDIIELTATLAEARLQAKFANDASLKSVAEADRRVEEALEQAPPAAGDLEAADPASHESPEVNEPFTEKEARGALIAMRRCHQAFTKSPTDLSLINELYSHAHGFSERARVSGLVALHRLSAAFAGLTSHLYRVPESLNPSTMRTVQQTIEFLTALVRERNLTHLHDPAKAQVYVVDDDADNCHAIGMALEMVMLRTISAQDPAVALAEIGGGRFDLLLLDINLPGMDGFELCRHIRETPSYATTPIVFLTGLNTLERRTQSALSGGSDFIAKPFNLHELGVKALTLILKTQLGIG